MKIAGAILPALLVTSGWCAAPAPLPQLAGDRLYAWYRADSGVTVNPSGFVIRWEDSSGHNRDLTPVTKSPLSGPILVRHAVGGRPALRFDTHCALRCEPSTFGSLAGPKTIIAVVLVRSAEKGYVFDSADKSGRNTLHTGNGKYRGTWDLNSGSLHGTTIGPRVKNDVWMVHTAVYDWHQNRHYINGREVSRGNFDVHSLTGLTVGCRWTLDNCIDADIAELRIYRGVLSGIEQAGIEQYLELHYGIGAHGVQL